MIKSVVVGIVFIGCLDGFNLLSVLMVMESVRPVLMNTGEIGGE
jgi:hypothetical protein